MSESAPAGWYGQPDGGQRWWDGFQWTAHVRPGLNPPPPPSPYSHLAGTTFQGHAPYAVAPKSPGLALLASFFIPGLGSMLNGEVGKGVAILVSSVVCWVLAILIVPILVAVGLWIYGMVDAYSGAQKWNSQHGILS